MMIPPRPLTPHLPTTRQECKALGWDGVDIVLITGDAYVDHPAFGIALIGRLLESHGYRVVILPQPRYDRLDDFQQFGRPRLFFGISAGNLDSIVANYSGNGKVRNQDAYSPNGNPWFTSKQAKSNRRRPDRATLLYANLARAAYADVPLVLGGIEASLRRFIHYDYKQEHLRGSILADAKADLLLYGMGEKSVLEAAARIKNKLSLDGIPGSCRRMMDRELSSLDTDQAPPGLERKIVALPSWDEIQKDTHRFMEAERIIDRQARSNAPHLLIQRQQGVWVLQYPAPSPLTTEEMDALYALPFSRAPHPSTPDIPAYRMIRHSITIVRGCSGNCSFCAISRHQGAVISSRSKESILREAVEIRKMDDFSGTITDLGGPTANLYGSQCSLTTCKKHDCLYPDVCRHLRLDEDALLDVLRDVSSLEDIHHVFISSGLRMGLLLQTPRILEAIIRSHIPGSMKIAPEHTEEEILTAMHKEGHKNLRTFLDRCRNVAQRLGKEIRFTPYIVTAHPGCTERHTARMAKKLEQLGLHVRQFQDFTPTPGTLSTAMYVTGLHRDTNLPISVPRNQSEKKRQREILEKYLSKPKEKPLSDIKKKQQK